MGHADWLGKLSKLYIDDPEDGEVGFVGVTDEARNVPGCSLPGFAW